MAKEWNIYASWNPWHGCTFHQTGAYFIKDGRMYRIPRRHQLSQAHKAGIDFGINEYYVPSKPGNLWEE